MFKHCPNCGAHWHLRNDFLNDPGLQVIGYQVDFRALDTGIFLFNHVCKGTLAVHASDFRDLYTGPVFRTRATGGDACPGHCLHKDDLAPCPVRCECAYVREILQLIKSWSKKE